MPQKTRIASSRVHRNAARRALAVPAVAVATLARQLLDQRLGDKGPFATCFSSITLIASLKLIGKGSQKKWETKR